MKTLTLTITILAFPVLSWALPPNVMAPFRPAASAEEAAPAYENAQAAMYAAQRKATRWASGSQTLPKTASWRDWITPNAVAPVNGMSVGNVSEGRLLNGSELSPEGKAHRVFERHQTYQTRYGTPELVELIERGAEHVQLHAPGAPLMVGNMSRRNGGDIRWSRSHNSGRDADLAFYVLDAKGRSIPAPELLQFNERGVPVGYPDYRFDVERNWLLVRGLLSVPSVQVQYLFISLPLKAMLLEHARSRGESEELIARAADVLHQPHDALPHDDHFHLRIACPPKHRVRGCLETGPRWDWGNWGEDELLAQAIELSKAFLEGNDQDKLKVLDFLTALNSPYLADIAMIWGVKDSNPEIRQRSLASAHSAWPWSGATLARVMEFIRNEAQDDNELGMAYSILRRSIASEVQGFALLRIRDENVQISERIMAARTLMHFVDESLVPDLLNELASQPLPVAHELARHLERITGRGSDLDWRGASEEHRNREIETWRRWFQANSELGREIWVLAGLKELGYRRPTVDAQAIDDLISLLPKAPDHLVYNINRKLREYTGRWAPLEQSDGQKLQNYWASWWKRNRARHE